MKHLMKVTFTVFLTISFGLISAQQRRAENPVLNSLKDEKDPSVLKNKLSQLEKTGSEENLTLLLRYYYSVENNAKADSLLQVVVTKYPSGNQALIQFQNTVYTLRGGKAQEDYYVANQHKFPSANLDYVYYSIANAYATEGNVPKMKEYGNMVKDTYFRSATIRLNGRALMAKDVHAAEAYVRPEIERLLAMGIPAAPSADQGNQPNENRASYLEFMDLYSGILIKTGKYDEALTYAKEAYDYAKSNNDLQKGNYALLLSKNGKHQEALPVLEDLIASGKGSGDLKLALKQSYEKLNPGKDATAYIAKIEQGMQSKIESEVSKMLVKEAAPHFTVTDVNGNTVSLGDFAGKTIVLDFWATWCGPCVKSFPAMQMAVDKYKDNPNVKFLFIHTWERVADPLADAKGYLSSNKYNLDLYMDMKDAKTKTNPAVSAFGVKGIPAKFVVDGKGNIRFKMMGFSGGDDAAVAELSAMIEIAIKS